MESTDDKQALALSNSAFSKDFSQVPISTTKPQQFHARNLQSHPMPPIQAKLTIGEPNDRYEQEADRVASEVVRRINAPRSAGQSVQRQEEAEEEIQAKPEITSLQRMKEPEAELQAKLTLQRREAIAGGETSTDLESTINRARGSGQPLEAGLQQSMGQAMGADFSGVKVHTDAQSDQLNRSIQAKAFTTGQDVFFRQGAYEPWSRGGQELLAHELTHVAQQNGGAVQRWPLPPQQLLQHPAIETPSALVGKGVLQKADVNPTTFFTGARADTAVDADINANNKMSGFGTQVNGADWHTQLTFGPLSSAQAGPNGMKPEGTSVIGVIGPDHPYGSQPKSETAKTNNGIAAKLRGGKSHVAAHIVNDQLGGPGITQNLFAFPSTANTVMEKQVEKSMKKAVMDGNYIYYQANVNHPTNNGPADFITMSWNKLDHIGKDIGGGQTNVKINAGNIKDNTKIVDLENNKVAAQNKNLIQPITETVIQRRPWGPFQMPDPKKKVSIGDFLDSTTNCKVRSAIA
ncbi:MAG: DUF4157 domain-containing protein [Nostoc sp. NMS7]|nr:DUF4157 domain-containing protein [Nostoc sp. NMS7]